jgi:class 3 adenylate cyclase
MDPHLTAKPGEPRQPQIAQVLFMDVVGFTKIKRMRDQLGLRYQLTDIVRNSTEYRLKEEGTSVICLSTGDGMALVFFDDPAAPIRCAIEISDKIRRQTAIGLRIGLHSGPVYRHPDIRKQPDVTGEGINIAQRVMSGGDPNHILLSRAMGDILIALGDWNDYISELFLIEVKDRLRLPVYNFSSEGLGNPNFPTKRVFEGKAQSLVRTAGSSLPRKEPGSTINAGKNAITKKPSTQTNDLTRLRNCGKCGMLLYRDSVSCMRCGYENL